MVTNDPHEIHAAECRCSRVCQKLQQIADRSEAFANRLDMLKSANACCQEWFGSGKYYTNDVLKFALFLSDELSGNVTSTVADDDFDDEDDTE